MKNIFLALAVLTSGAFAHAEALSATGVWTCHIEAETVSNNSGLFVAIAYDSIAATGVVKCTAWNGVQTTQVVGVSIAGYGLGIGYATSVQDAGVKFVSAKVGISDPEGMIGEYQVTAVTGATLFASRVGFGASTDITPNSSFAAALKFDIRDQVGFGWEVIGLRNVSVVAIAPIVYSNK